MAGIDATKIGKFTAEPVEWGLDKGPPPNEFPCVRVLFEITSGPQYKQRRFAKWWLNTPENVDRAIKNLRTCGWKGKKFGDWMGMGSENVMIDVRGREGTGQNQGQVFYEVAFVNRIASLPKPTITDAAVADLNARFSARIANAKEEDKPARSWGNEDLSSDESEARFG